MVQPHSTEIVPNRLQRIVERLRNPSEIGRARRWRRPRIDQRRNAHKGQSGRRARTWRRADQLAWQRSGTRRRIGHKVYSGLVQMLPESFIIGEQKRLVLPHRSAQRPAKLVALKSGRGTRVEVIRRVQRIISQKFQNRSVQLVASRLRDNQNLRARPLAILRAVGIGQHVEFAHRVYT